MTAKQRCAQCGHEEDSHDGYGGLCDGLQDDAKSHEEFEALMDARAQCGCHAFVPSSSRTPDDPTWCETCGSYQVEGHEHRTLTPTLTRCSDPKCECNADRITEQTPEPTEPMTFEQWLDSQRSLLPAGHMSTAEQWSAGGWHARDAEIAALKEQIAGCEQMLMPPGAWGPVHWRECAHCGKPYPEWTVSSGLTCRACEIAAKDARIRQLEDVLRTIDTTTHSAAGMSFCAGCEARKAVWNG